MAYQSAAAVSVHSVPVFMYTVHRTLIQSDTLPFTVLTIGAQC